MKWWFFILVLLPVLAPAQGKRAAAPPGQLGGTANLVLTVYLVSGTAEAQADFKEDVPQELTEVLQQLKGVFAFKRYKLVDSVTLRGRNNGSAEVGGELPDYSFYNFRYGRARISPETPHIVHLDSLRLEITRRHSNRIDTIALVSTDLDVRDGQKAVVGKSAVNSTGALFLVVVPTVIE